MRYIIEHRTRYSTIYYKFKKDIDIDIKKGDRVSFNYKDKRYSSEVKKRQINLEEDTITLIVKLDSDY